MRVRSQIRRLLDATVGARRTDRIRAWERRVRGIKADVRARAASAPAGIAITPERSKRYRPSDPFAEFPAASMSRHQLLRGLHRSLAPRTYLEIGIDDGWSLIHSRTKSIGIDPAFHIKTEICCDVQLVRATSDEFFDRPDPLAHFDGLPIDLAFIDGMHLSEYALRDFINVEKHMSPYGVIVLDDMLPRNALEAARVRRTTEWTGDVFKVAEFILEHRPDLTLVPVNTSPTGTCVIVGFGAGTAALEEHMAALLDVCRTPDPQHIAAVWLRRESAVDPAALLDSGAWQQLAAGRVAGDDLGAVRATLAALPRMTSRTR